MSDHDNMGVDTARARDNGDMFAQSWPEGHTFTVAFKVLVPGEMAHFMRHMYKHEPLYGCSVERVDFKDRATEAEAKVERLKALAQAFLEEAMS